MAKSLKPLRAFAEITTPVLVQHTDLEGVILTLADTKIPEEELKPDPPMPDDAQER
ncbi:hypothetical protein SAMN05421770_102537 [Granulicella rosea]|uniref:Uncharacterized protein n=1 Tax=Granulicella rosea TaxID=474952 RepID=A0A239HTR9_9BACT|nr:hypothetical protein [Granulicella rosea]SNS84173.1 hypothetical protein SAMN05421770_102537 [Granulicella rosea]